jgi:hypothetical protein
MNTRNSTATSITIAPSSPVKRSRWRDWNPQAQLPTDSAASAGTEPPKPGSVGFVGATLTESSEIHPAPDPAELARASAVLNQAGVRIMQLDGVTTIGIWSDLDGAEIRRALRTFGADQLPVRYLDGAGIPPRYKLRRVEGEPVPTNVLAEMERHPDEPWKVRDRMWKAETVAAWAEWKAASLNRLFLELTGRPGRITAATVLDGARKRGAQLRDSPPGDGCAGVAGRRAT